MIPLNRKEKNTFEYFLDNDGGLIKNHNMRMNIIQDNKRFFVIGQHVEVLYELAKINIFHTIKNKHIKEDNNNIGSIVISIIKGFPVFLSGMFIVDFHPTIENVCEIAKKEVNNGSGSFSTYCYIAIARCLFLTTSNPLEILIGGEDTISNTAYKVPGIIEKE